MDSEKLCAQIGQLKVENDFLKKAPKGQICHGKTAINKTNDQWGQHAQAMWHFTSKSFESLLLAIGRITREPYNHGTDGQACDHLPRQRCALNGEHVGRKRVQGQP